MTAKEVTRRSGIDTIIPGMMIDDHLFTPCGYSMNGLLEKYYMTIHVTPEQNFSFVSIETNVPQKCYASFIGKLIHLFKPGKFMLNLFVPSVKNLNRSKLIFSYENQTRLPLFAVNDFVNSNDSDITMDDDDDGESDTFSTQTLEAATKPKSFANASLGSMKTDIDSSMKIHGMMIYELLSGDWTDHLSAKRYHRKDFQMVQNDHLDIIYARYSIEGVS
ncbi:hypothetical protein SSS_02120 [Sarcoptes scabiei]|nr:hypothetical protein SSS_02120 [Sarcoptes scabiei]